MHGAFPEVNISIFFKPAVTTSSTEAIDSERPTAMVVETPNVRRGGRGKGRKGGAIKETAQVQC